MSQKPCRRAAIIVANLDRHAADALLERLPEAQAIEIRHEIMSLSERESQECDTVIQDYLNGQDVDFAAIEQDPESAAVPESQLVSSSASAASINPCASSIQSCVEVAELLQLDDETIAIALYHERVSTITALLSALPGNRAAQTLRLLPAENRARVVASLSLGVQPDKQAVAAIADAICQQSAAVLRPPLPAGEQVDAVQSILSEFSPHERYDMISDLEQQNPVLAQRLRQRS